jgi:AraC family transcriptional activator of pobA
MQKKSKSIPVTNLAAAFSTGVFISKIYATDSSTFKEVGKSHRDDWHLFLLQEKGTTAIEIDFQKHLIEPASVVYIHPNQVHRVIAFENATFTSWFISSENLKPEYLKLLEDISPVKALPLNHETFSIISETASLCIKHYERRHERLYISLLQDSCNALVALVASQFLARPKLADKSSRSEVNTKAFRSALERDFAIIKSPAEYAKNLNISTPYLNECVKNTTGYSVSYHIQQRSILEAKRLLYHSDQSVKEIASELGYDDSSYFTRLFAKITGMSPLAFRNKNLD